MHVMDHGDSRTAGPQRGEEGKPVEDLHQPVPGTVTAEQAGQGGAWDHRYRPAVADHTVPIAVDLDRSPSNPSRPQGDLEAGSGPGPCDLVGVLLGSARGRVISIAPGHHVDTPESGLVGEPGHRRERLRLEVGTIGAALSAGRGRHGR